MKKLKRPLLFALAILPIAALGGLFTGMYTYEYYTPQTRQLLLSQVGSYQNFLLITTLQSTIYGILAAFFGYILSEKIGLMRPLKFEKTTFVKVSLLTVLCGILFSLDYFVFGAIIPQVKASYAMGISPSYFLAALTYGGIIEEVLMRLFLMSLICLLTWKIFLRKYTKENIPTWVFVASNILTALLFAAGHIPTTISLFGTLTPLILFRCFLLNGALGLVFGRFYRKYGIQYAMVGHFGCHLVSKLILLFVL